MPEATPTPVPQDEQLRPSAWDPDNPCYPYEPGPDVPEGSLEASGVMFGDDLYDDPYRDNSNEGMGHVDWRGTQSPK